MAKLQKDFYTGENTIAIAKQLLGKKLVSRFNGITTAGIIQETEAYCGITDRGCHAYKGRFTDRTKIMYSKGGVCYVYLCYGMHFLFNVITHREGEPHAILIRAIEPVEGINHILLRRNKITKDGTLGAGPALVSQCLGFTTKHTGISLLGSTVWIEDEENIPQKQIVESPRVGMNFTGHYKLIPWRFRIKGSPYTSKAK